MDARRPFAHDADRSLRAAHRGGAAHAAHLVALFPAAARALRSVAARRAARVPRAGDAARTQRRVARPPRHGRLSGRTARRGSRDLPLPRRISPRQTAHRRRARRLGRHGQLRLPKSGIQHRGDRRCCSIPRRCGRRSGASTKTSPRALRSIPKRGGAARYTTGWATASHGSSHRCCNKRRLA